jgi:hypothetical protein
MAEKSAKSTRKKLGDTMTEKEARKSEKDMKILCCWF